MKKQILTCLLAVGVSTAMFGQSVFLDLTANSGALGATSNGLLYRDGVLLAGGEVNVTLWGGPTADSATNLVVSLTGVNACIVPIPGGAYDLAGLAYNIPGMAATPNVAGFLNAQWWIGNAASYEAAVAAQQYAGASGVFSNPTGGGGAPPTVPPTLTGMPSVNLTATVVPEPSAMVLGALGLASLLVFRRRN